MARKVLYHVDNFLYLTKVLYVISYKILCNIPYISYLKGNILFHDFKLFPVVPSMYQIYDHIYLLLII